MSCNQHYGIANYPPCSGNGDCIDGRCICHQGWFDISDYNIQRGLDCDNNLYIIKYWALVNLIIACCTLLLYMYCLHREIISSYSRSKMWTMTTDSKQAGLMLTIIANICLLLCSIYRYIGREKYLEEIDLHPQLAIFGVGAMSAVAFNVSCFHLLLVKFLQGYMMFVDVKVRDHLMHVMSVTSSLAYVFPVVYSAVLVAITIACALDRDQSSNIYATMILLAFSIAYMYFSCSILYIFEVFLRELNRYLAGNQSGPSNDTATYLYANSLYQKFKLASRVFTPSLLGGIPLNLLFLCWNFLRRKTTYLFLFHTTTILLTTPFFVVPVRFTREPKIQSSSAKSRKIIICNPQSKATSGSMLVVRVSSNKSSRIFPSIHQVHVDLPSKNPFMDTTA
jgi:hypothetical protein